MSQRWAQEHDRDLEQMMSPGDDKDPPRHWPPARRNRWPISKGVSHCGAGFTLGDIIGEWIVYLTALAKCDPLLLGLALRPVMAVEAQLRAVREVA